MAVFKACVKTQREDGYYKVYIRVIHNRKICYIPTSMLTSKLKKGEISDNTIIKRCSILIDGFINKLNNMNISEWDVRDIASLLTSEQDVMSFTEYAEIHIQRMIAENRAAPAGVYKTVVKKLHEFANKNQLLFSDISSKLINAWIESLKETNNAKNKYPKYIKAIFNAACTELNDYDKDIIKIKNQPFRNVKIPSVCEPEKRAVDKNILSKFFNSDLIHLTQREELAKDVMLLSFCLVGMNTADLYDLRKENLHDNWKLCYNRKKTRDERGNHAYIELTVPQNIRYLFEKYTGRERLFCFSDRYSTPNNFNKYINQSIKRICSLIDIDILTSYTFRHSWATIAQNECNASTQLVAFSLNHSSAHKVTEGYIKKDFSPIDKLNTKVIKKVLSNQKAHS